jgi:septum formation protein
MKNKIILASRSGVRKTILEKNGIECEIVPADIDEDEVKISLISENATPEIISKNLAELKANKISKKRPNEIVLGADSVVDLKNNLISKPTNRSEALKILQKLNGQKHQLISSVCISINGSMIWNFTDASNLTMKKLNLDQIKSYLSKIRDKELFAYGVYQIEADGRSLFSKIEGDENSVMGLPIKQIKEYLGSLK